MENKGRAKKHFIEERLRILATAVEQSIDGIAVADVNGDIKFINSTWANMHGYSVSELIGKNLSIFHTPEQMKEDVTPFLKQVRKIGAHHGEVGHVRKDGTTFETWMSVTLLRDEKGKPIGLAGMARDITDRKKMKENLKKLNKELLRSNKRLKQLALRDPQTGLYNHHYLPEAIKAEFYRARRYFHPFSLMMIDIDYFKSINDVYGHKFGDLVLKQVVRQLIKNVRRYDVIIRFGGEEFVVVSPGTDRYAILILARRLLDSINLCNFGNKEHTIKLTFSIAVVSYPEDKVVKYMDLIDLADQVLNKVKEDGGDRVYSSMDMKKKEKKKAAVIEEEKENAEIKFLREKLEKLTKKSKQNLIESIFAFAKTIELKDHYTGEHVEKTVHYAAEIARALGLSEAEIMCVRQAAILHDLGKVGISEKILLKKSKLKKKEFEEIMKHPQIGTDVIRPIKLLHDIIPMVLYHHENWDGKGYPAGLKGEDIPIGARIISLSDAYQALISDRPYRKAYPKHKVIKIIKEFSGTKFDPEIVKVFLKILQEENKKK